MSKAASQYPENMNLQYGELTRAAPVEKMDCQWGDIVGQCPVVPTYDLTDSDVDSIEEARFLQGILSVTAISINEAFNAAAGFTSPPGVAIKQWLDELRPAWNLLVSRLDSLTEDSTRTVFVDQSILAQANGA